MLNLKFALLGNRYVENTRNLSIVKIIFELVVSKIEIS